MIEAKLSMRGASRHWFYLLLPAWALATMAFRACVDWSDEPRIGEAVALFDWCVFMPTLYVLCYRGTLPLRVLVVRTAAIACSGFWIAGLIVPDPAERLLRDLSWLRTAGLGALLLVEAGIMVAMLRTVFSDRPDRRALERLGVPAVLARLMLAEARFWRRVWSRLRGR